MTFQVIVAHAVLVDVTPKVTHTFVEAKETTKIKKEEIYLNVFPKFRVTNE